MFKKVNVVFDKKLIKKIELDKQFQQSQRLCYVMELLYEVVMYGISQRYDSVYVGPGGLLLKYFSKSLCKGKQFANAFLSADRVNAFISLWIGDSVMVNLCFFEKGNKKPVFEMELSFLDNGVSNGILTIF